MAGGGGAKEVEEEEEYIYAVKDDEVMAHAEHHTSDAFKCDAGNSVCPLWVSHDGYYTGLWACTVQISERKSSSQNSWSAIHFFPLNYYHYH